MTSMFRIASTIGRDEEHWGIRRWVSHPPSTGASHLTVVEATLSPGMGHGFHKHPGQEEVIYVVAGKIEQWVDRDKRTLSAGDAVFVPPGVVHASFHAGEGDATMVAIFGPSIGDEGYETVDMAGEIPWRDLRS